MDTMGNALLGIAFLLTSTGSTFLMFYLWGFPFDKETHQSGAPPGLMRLHRILGYIYLGLYLYFMWAMVPRLWTYQVELPARTVVHLTLGMAIGAVLVVKLAIVHYFKHLESQLAPLLGTALFVCTTLLIGLSVPFTLREAYLRQDAQAADGFSPERLERIRSFFSQNNATEADRITELTSAAGLNAGRQVLLGPCVQCHDLRTVLVRPRTPANWYQTVQRMANRSDLFVPITPTEQLQVTAYLIAISPALKKTAQQERAEAQQANQTLLAANQVGRQPEADDSSVGPEPYDRAEAQLVFEELCSQCHELSDVDLDPPQSDAEVHELIVRMVENGMEASAQELSQVTQYMNDRYVKRATTPID